MSERVEPRGSMVTARTAGIVKRVFGRLPPCIPSRLRLAGVRKPLTKAEIQLRHYRASSGFDSISAIMVNRLICGNSIVLKS